MPDGIVHAVDDQTGEVACRFDGELIEIEADWDSPAFASVKCADCEQEFARRRLSAECSALDSSPGGAPNALTSTSAVHCRREPQGCVAVLVPSSATTGTSRRARRARRARLPQAPADPVPVRMFEAVSHRSESRTGWPSSWSRMPVMISCRGRSYLSGRPTACAMSIVFEFLRNSRFASPRTHRTSSLGVLST